MVPVGDETLQAAIERCRACREPCERYLHGADRVRNPSGFAEMLRCVALLSMIGERLETDGYLPDELTHATIELARELPHDSFGCAAACQAAADALSDLLDGGYERS